MTSRNPSPKDLDRDVRTRARRAQQHELDDAVVSPPFGAITATQAVGAIRGSVIGAVVGALLGALVGLLVDLASWSEWAEVGIFALAGAMAASAVGFVFGGGHEPDAAGETPEPEDTAAHRRGGRA